MSGPGLARPIPAHSEEDGTKGEVGVDLFRTDELRELLRDVRGPAVSIYIPQSGEAPDPSATRLRFRAALDRARVMIGADPRYASDVAVLEPLEPLAQDPAMWAGDGSVAIFQAPDVSRRYRLPARFPELVVVAPSFHTRPLLEHLQAPDRFWVLELAQKGVRLWTGDAHRVRPVEPSPLPSDLVETLGYEYAREPEVVHRSSNAGGRGGNIRAQAGGSVGAFHGHGAGADDHRSDLEKFFRIIDDRLRETLGSSMEPVILASVAEHQPLYRSVSRLESLTPKGIEGSIRDWSADRVHEAAWPLAVEASGARTDRALALWEAAYGRGKGETDLAALGPLAVTGRIHVLLIERARHIWGRLDRATGAVDVVQRGGEDPGATAAELLDELSEVVLLHGGEVRVVPADRMPTGTGAAGILR